MISDKTDLSMKKSSKRKRGDIFSYMGFYENGEKKGKISVSPA